MSENKSIFLGGGVWLKMLQQIAQYTEKLNWRAALWEDLNIFLWFCPLIAYQTLMFFH